MIQIKPPYQSPNWDKRLNEYCKENRKAKKELGN